MISDFDDEKTRDLIRMWSLHRWAVKYPLAFLARVTRRMAENEYAEPGCHDGLKVVEKIVADHFDG